MANALSILTRWCQPALVSHGIGAPMSMGAWREISPQLSLPDKRHVMLPNDRGRVAPTTNSLSADSRVSVITSR